VGGVSRRRKTSMEDGGGRPEQPWGERKGKLDGMKDWG